MSGLMPRALLILLISASLSHALPAAVPTLDQGLSLQSVRNPQISPDGRWVVYELQQTDWKENAYVQQLWLADSSGGRNVQLTRGKKSATGAQWSPDGRWIAFMTEREWGAIQPEKPNADKETAGPEKGEAKGEAKKEQPDAKPDAQQIWLISPSGGEAWMLTKHGAKIDGFAWSKDGRSLAFLAPEPESKSAKAREERYSKYQVVERDYQQNQLWLVDVAAALEETAPLAARQLTKGASRNINHLDWSPDSKWIAFDASPDPLLAHNGDSDIYLLDLAHDDRVRKVVALPGPDGNPMFSPDGASIAFSTSLAEPYFYYTNEHIAVVKTATVLEHPATTVSGVNDLTGKFDEDASLVAWERDGIYFQGWQKTSSHLFRIDPATAAIRRVTAPDALVARNANLTPDARSVTMSRATPRTCRRSTSHPSHRFNRSH